MANKKMYMHQSIAQALAEHNVDTLFGLIGDSNLFFVDHFKSAFGGKTVDVAHEGGAVLMSQAYTQTTGKVGIAHVTQGPGLTNCVTALREGVLARRPTVLICGDTPVSDPLHQQNIDQREVVKATGAGFEQVMSPETASLNLANAMYRAQNEKRPIVLNVPTDFNWVEVDHKKVVHPFHNAPACVSSGPQYEQAIEMIASAKRPIVLAGAGGIGAKESLIALAERLEAPLATTLKGTGLFKGHPNNIGYYGGLSTAEAMDVIHASDCIIAFGALLHYFTTERGGLLDSKKVIYVNNTRSDVGAFHKPDAALIADATLTADNILQRLNQDNVAPSGFAKQLPAHDISRPPKGDKTKTTQGFINFEYALDRLNEALPANRMMLTDGGRFVTEVWCRVEVPDPNSFHMTLYSAAIGQGMQQAIGAAHGDPSRPTVLFSGDGGFMMGGLSEFNTAVRSGADVIVIICNDGAYGAEHVQYVDKKLDPSMAEIDWPSFAEVAKSLGGDGIEVTSADELEDAIDFINNRKGPIIVDLKMDPNNIPPMRGKPPLKP